MDIPPEGKDPALWGGLTAFILVRIPLLQRISYFIVGVVTAKFLAPEATKFSGASLEAASYLLAVFGFLLLEKLVGIITNVNEKTAAGDAWEAFRSLFKRG